MNSLPGARPALVFGRRGRALRDAWDEWGGPPGAPFHSLSTPDLSSGAMLVAVTG